MKAYVFFLFLYGNGIALYAKCHYACFFDTTIFPSQERSRNSIELAYNFHIVLNVVFNTCVYYPQQNIPAIKNSDKNCFLPPSFYSFSFIRLVKGIISSGVSCIPCRIHSSTAPKINPATADFQQRPHPLFLFFVIVLFFRLDVLFKPNITDREIFINPSAVVVVNFHLDLHF